MRKDYNPGEEGIHLLNFTSIADEMGYQNLMEGLHKTQRGINELLSNPKDNPYVQLQKWRKLGQSMKVMINTFQEVTDGYKNQIDRVSNLTMENSNKRWSKEADEKLIDCICSGKYSLVELSTIFGRTPTAISSRVSYLVGIQRLSQEIAGNFIGKLNGENIQGKIEGVINYDEC